MAIPNFPWPRLESSTIIVQFSGKSYFILDPNSLIYIPYPRVNCLKTIPFTAAHTYKAHSEVERERDFSPVFPNLPDASQKSIITVLKQAKPGSLYLVMSVKLVVVSTVHHQLI